jgi:uncharacterized protein with ParB-like and HNH nuclease domain
LFKAGTVCLFIGTTYKLLIKCIAIFRTLRLNAAEMSKELLKENRKVKPAEVIKILSSYGREITQEEAQKILDFLYFLGKLTVDQYIKENSTSDNSYENSRSVRKGEHGGASG